MLWQLGRCNGFQRTADSGSTATSFEVDKGRKMAICRRGQAQDSSGEGKESRENLQATVGWQQVEPPWPGDDSAIAQIGRLLQRYLPWPQVTENVRVDDILSLDCERKATEAWPAVAPDKRLLLLRISTRSR